MVLFGATALSLALTVTACSQADGPTAVSPVAGAGENGDGSTRASAAAPLAGQWRLVSLQPTDGPSQRVPAGTSFTADFGSDGRLAAIVDCNRCRTSYEATADTLSVGATMACTRAYCAASAGFDETYTRLLTLSSAWRVQGATLELSGEAGSLTLTR
jgi:heat shock protein HslJ